MNAQSTLSSPLTGQGLTKAEFEQFLSTRSEPDWVTEMRRSAWEVFESKPVPSLRDEEWMRTDIRLFKWNADLLSVPDAGSATPGEGLLKKNVDLGGDLVQVNGNVAKHALNAGLASRGVVFLPLEQALREKGALVREHLFKRAFNVGYDKFSALHAAAFTGGALVYIPRGVKVEQPLRLHSIMTDGGVDRGHCLVILEDGAELTLLAECESETPNSAGLHCGGVELVVGPNASLRYVNLQNWGDRVWHFAHKKGVVGARGALQWTIGALGSRLAKVNQHVELAGEHAQAQVNGVMFTEGKQHLSYHTLQHHRAPHCKSDLLYEGALQDESRTVWRGMIKVDPGAHKTDGYQRNDNLMLSESARADSIPGLEIEADDVRCTHGATVGRVEDEMVFYAQSRGLTKKEAVRTIVSGFFQKVFDRITLESVRDALGEAIGKRVREYV